MAVATGDWSCGTIMRTLEIVCSISYTPVHRCRHLHRVNLLSLIESMRLWTANKSRICCLRMRCAHERVFIEPTAHWQRCVGATTTGISFWKIKRKKTRLTVWIWNQSWHSRGGQQMNRLYVLDQAFSEWAKFTSEILFRIFGIEWFHFFVTI